MNMLIICALMVLYISIISTVLIFAAYQLSKELKNNRILKEKEFLLTVDANKDIMDLLDSFIEDSLIQYRIKYLDSKDNLHISESKQKEMVKNVLSDVLNSMSPVLYEKLTYIYNKDNLENTIYLKVSLAVLSYVIEVNGSYKE